MTLTQPPPKTDAVRAPSPRSPGSMLRSDLWRGFVAFGIVMSLVFSFHAMRQADETVAAAPTGNRELQLTLSDLKIEPAELSAPSGNLRLHLTNDGATAHNVVIDELGARSSMIEPGGSDVLELANIDAGTYELYCEVAGHKDAGMRSTLTVGDDGDGTAHGAMSSDDMDASYMAGVKAFPAKTRGVGGVEMQPEMDGGTKVYELTAAETQWAVAPGDVKTAMAYNGIVPGPQIHVRQGDRVRIHLNNELEESTAMHFHGLDVPNDQDGVPGITQDLVKPGQSHTYEFTVPNAGTHMYHSHMNGATQIPMGLLGAFIVDGKDEPKVDVDTSIILNDGPLGFTINGKSFPATAPIVAKPGQTLRLRYLNEGLQGHPMHLHGMAQKVIRQDGYPVPEPYELDTLWIAPGQRFDVLVTVRPGVWAFHCHILSHAETEAGMFGMVSAVVAQ